MRPSVLDYLLWMAGPLCHLLVLSVIMRKRRLNGLSIFFSYLLVVPLDSLLLFFVMKGGSERAYYMTYWITGYIEYVLQFCVTAQLIWHVLTPLSGWLRGTWRVLLCWSVIATFIAALLSFSIGPSASAAKVLTNFNRWELHTSIFRSLIICGAVLATYSIANRFYLHIGRHCIAILFGLFAWSYTPLLVDLAREMYGWNREIILLNEVQKVVYLGVLVYWVAVLWVAEKERPPLPPEAFARMVALHDQVKVDIVRMEETRQ